MITVKIDSLDLHKFLYFNRAFEVSELPEGLVDYLRELYFADVDLHFQILRMAQHVANEMVQRRNLFTNDVDVIKWVVGIARKPGKVNQSKY